MSERIDNTPITYTVIPVKYATVDTSQTRVSTSNIEINSQVKLPIALASLAGSNEIWYNQTKLYINIEDYNKYIIKQDSY